MTNCELLKKATVEDVAKFFEKNVTCTGCIIRTECMNYNKTQYVSCREAFRRWLGSVVIDG